MAPGKKRSFWAARALSRTLAAGFRKWTEIALTENQNSRGPVELAAALTLE